MVKCTAVLLVLHTRLLGLPSGPVLGAAQFNVGNLASQAAPLPDCRCDCCEVSRRVPSAVDHGNGHKGPWECVPNQEKVATCGETCSLGAGGGHLPHLLSNVAGVAEHCYHACEPSAPKSGSQCKMVETVAPTATVTQLPLNAMPELSPAAAMGVPQVFTPAAAAPAPAAGSAIIPTARQNLTDKEKELMAIIAARQAGMRIQKMLDKAAQTALPHADGSESHAVAAIKRTIAFKPELTGGSQQAGPAPAPAPASSEGVPPDMLMNPATPPPAAQTAMLAKSRQLKLKT